MSGFGIGLILAAIIDGLLPESHSLLKGNNLPGGRYSG